MAEQTNLLPPTEEDLKLTLDSEEGTKTEKINADEVSRLVSEQLEQDTPVDLEPTEIFQTTEEKIGTLPQDQANKLAKVTTMNNPDFYAMPFLEAMRKMDEEIYSKTDTYEIEGEYAFDQDMLRNSLATESDKVEAIKDLATDEGEPYFFETTASAAEALDLLMRRTKLMTDLDKVMSGQSEIARSIAEASGFPVDKRPKTKRELRELQNSYKFIQDTYDRYIQSAAKAATEFEGAGQTVVHSISYAGSQLIEAEKGIPRERIQNIAETVASDPNAGALLLRELTEEPGFNSLTEWRQGEIMMDIFNNTPISRKMNNSLIALDLITLGKGEAVSEVAGGIVKGAISATKYSLKGKPIRGVGLAVKEVASGIVKGVTAIPSELKSITLAAGEVGLGVGKGFFKKELAPAGKGLLNLSLTEIPVKRIVIGDTAIKVYPSTKMEALEQAMEAITKKVSAKAGQVAEGEINPTLAGLGAFAEVKGYVGTEIGRVIEEKGIAKVVPSGMSSNTELDVVDVFVDNTTGRGFATKEAASEYAETFNVEGAKVVQLGSDSVEEIAKVRAAQKALVKEDLEIHDALTALSPANIQANLVRPDTNQFDGRQLRKLINVLKKSESSIPAKDNLVNLLEDISKKKSLTHNDIRDINGFIKAYKGIVKEELDSSQAFIEENIKPRYGLAVERKIFPSVEATIEVKPEGLKSKAKMFASHFVSSRNFLHENFFKELNMSMSTFREVEKPLEQLRQEMLAKISPTAKSELDNVLNTSVKNGRWLELDELDDLIVNKDSTIIDEVKTAYKYLHYNNNLSLGVINSTKFKNLSNAGFHSGTIDIPGLKFQYDGNVKGYKFSNGQARGLLSGKNASILYLDFEDTASPLKRILPGGSDNTFVYNGDLRLTIDEAKTSKLKIIELDEPASIMLPDGSITVNRFLMVNEDTDQSVFKYVARALDKEQTDPNAFPRHIKSYYTHFVGQADIFTDGLSLNRTVRNDKNFLAFYSKKQAEQGAVKLRKAFDLYKKALNGDRSASYLLDQDDFVTKWRVAASVRIDDVPPTNEAFLTFMKNKQNINLDTPIEITTRGERTAEYGRVTRGMEVHKIMDFSSSEVINPYKKVKGDIGIHTVDFSLPDYDNALQQLATGQSLNVFGIEKEELLSRYMVAWVDKANQERLFGDEAKIFANNSDKIKMFMKPSLQGSIVASQSGVKEEMLAIRRALLNYGMKSDIYARPKENFVTDFLANVFSNTELPKFVKSILFGMTYSKAPSAIQSIATHAMIGCAKPFQYVGGLLTAMQLSAIKGNLLSPVEFLAAYPSMRAALRNGITDTEAKEILKVTSKLTGIKKQIMEVAIALLRHTHLGSKYTVTVLTSPSRGLERGLLSELSDISLSTFNEGNLAQAIGGAMTAAHELVKKYGKDITYEIVRDTKSILEEGAVLASRYAGGLDKSNPMRWTRGIFSFPFRLIGTYPLKMAETIINGLGKKATTQQKILAASSMAAVSTLMLGINATPLLGVAKKVPGVKDAWDRLFIDEEGNFDEQAAAVSRGMLSYMAWKATHGEMNIDMAKRASIFRTTGEFIESMAKSFTEKDFVTVALGPTYTTLRDPITQTYYTIKRISGSEDLTEEQMRALAFNWTKEAFVDSVGTFGDMYKAYYVNKLGQMRDKKGQILFTTDKVNAIAKALGLDLAQEVLYREATDLNMSKYKDKEKLVKMYEESIANMVTAYKSGDEGAQDKYATIAQLNAPILLDIVGPIEFNNIREKALKKNLVGATVLEKNDLYNQRYISQDPRDAEIMQFNYQAMLMDHTKNKEGKE